MTKMTATNRLRFVERISYVKDGESFVEPFKYRVLQQYWYVTGTLEEYYDQYGEWRDVPLEAE